MRGSFDMVLSTPQCARGFGGGRQPNRKEAEILNIWQHEHLNDHHWTPANLYAFVKRARHLVC
jgi:hypothetical protein